MTAARLEAVVHGRVQGVGFRMYVRDVARRNDLVGWVANEPSGAVRCVAEGAPDALQQLSIALRQGPPGSFVERVDEELSAAAGGGFSRFEIRSGSHPGD